MGYRGDGMGEEWAHCSGPFKCVSVIALDLPIFVVVRSEVKEQVWRGLRRRGGCQACKVMEGVGGTGGQPG